MNVALARFLKREGHLKTGNLDSSVLLRACLEFLSASRAEFVLASLEDLWAETRPQNVPGTWKERPNWRRKTRPTLEQILTMPELKEALQSIGELRRRRPVPRSGV